MVLLALSIGICEGVYFTYEDALRLYQQGAHADAEEIFRQLAQKGDARAQYHLGEMRLHGQAVEPDPAAACDWFETAADNGHVTALYELGNCYFGGRGRDQDIDQAIYLYGLAAESGLPQAQYRLAKLYAGGGPVPKNPERAYIYLLLALRGDLAQEPALRDSLEAKLSEEQLQRAQRFALKLLDRQAGKK